MAMAIRQTRLPDRSAAIAVGALGTGLGVVAVVVARNDPVGSFSGGSVRDGVLELAAGWALIAAGLGFSARRPGNRFGQMVAAAGFGWFVVELSNPGVGSALAFTIGLVGFVACAPLVAHAALLYPSGGIGSRFERAALLVAYADGFVLLGLLPTLVFDPAARGCLQCPSNLMLIRGDAGAEAVFLRWGLRIGLAWTTGVIVLLAWRMALARVPLDAGVPVLLAAVAYLCAVALYFGHALSPNLLGNDSYDLRLWRVEASALLVFAGGVAWALYRSRRARSAVARLVVELGRSFEPGGASRALAQALADPSLELGFLDSDSGDYLDADGRRIDPADDATRAVTPLVRDGRPVAVIVHEAALLRDPGLIEEVVSAGGLAIQHERFRAEVGAQLEHLRGSRTRIVEAGDTERRKLERDLHDGAQQRLVGVSLALRLLRNASTPGAALSGRLDEAEAELRAALEELRELAHGIFPASLAEEGLAAAIETLAESSPASVRLGTLTDRRFDPAVEAAAYFVVAEVLRRSQPARASVTASHVDARLLVDLETDTDVVEPLVDLEDRVGALDGQITVSRAGHGLHVRAELPCA